MMSTLSARQITVFICACFALRLGALQPCMIRIVDRDSQWPVPLVELRTTHNLRFISDNAGIIACDAPELMGRETWFTVIGHGYSVPRDGFGCAGVRLTPQPGITQCVAVTRTILARRIGRLTGGGLFAETLQCGGSAPLPENGAFGSDSVFVARYHEKLFWLWGDTALPNYPLGLFHTPGATTPLQPLPTAQPPLALPFDYFRDPKTQQPCNLAHFSGDGPTWLSGLVALPDQTGKQRLCAVYTKIKPPLDAYEIGLCCWDDARALFTPIRTLWRATDTHEKPIVPEGHAIRWRAADGTPHILFGNPLPRLSCPETFEAWNEPASWKTHTPQTTLRVKGDPARSIKLHSGSMVWHALRQRWLIVFMEAFGTPSTFGEIWYAEANDPFAEWTDAVKILTHESYTFYNPMVHQWLVPENKDYILFEGTYTHQFQNGAVQTPRWDYNQVLYRLDFADLERYKQR